MTIDIKSLARAHTVTAIKVLHGIMNSPKTQAAARISAANSLLERGWGKAAQPHIGGDADDPPISAILRVIKDAQDA